MKLFKRKPKELTPEQQEVIATKDFFDCVAPGTIKFLADSYIVGDTYRCAWAVKEYPPSTEEQAILSQLADRNGVTLRIYHRLVEPMEQRQIVNNANRKNRLMAGDNDLNQAIEAEGSRQNYRHVGFAFSYDEESYRILDQIFALIKQIKPVSTNGVRELWFRAERGTISDFGSFEEYQDMGEVDTYEEFENLWKAFYPDEVTWYRFQAVEDDYNGYRCITLKNKMVIEVDPDGEKSYPNDISEFAKWLLSELQRCIAELKAGTYNDYVEKNLPSRHRIGTIRRRDLWDIYPEEREAFFETLSDKDKQDFVQICMNQDEDAPVLGRLHNLTANDFYRFCAMGYKAMEYDGTELTPKEQYYKHADGRDNGLKEIDPDSPEAFKEWYHDDERRGGHPWEVCRGGNSTHISLFVVDHDDGYTLVVDGDAWTRTIESVKFFLALYRAGLPVSMRYGDLLAKRLTEDELIGVVPCTVFPAYCGQYFPGQDVIDYMQLPHDNEQEVAAKCVWQELVPTELLPEE